MIQYTGVRLRAQTKDYLDLVGTGMSIREKMVRTALQDAASVAGLKTQ